MTDAPRGLPRAKMPESGRPVEILALGDPA
jgi:hypothetical protein